MKRAIWKPALMILSIAFVFAASAQQASVSYVCPVPGSRYLNPEQNIILKIPKGFDPTSIATAYIHIEGQRSGLLQQDWMLSEDQTTLIIKPQQHFKLDEKIKVRISGLRTAQGQNIKSTFFNFYTREREVGEITLLHDPEPSGGGARDHGLKPRKVLEDKNTNDNNLPPDFPTILSVGGYIGDKYIFANLNPRLSQGQYSDYMVILDNFGTPIFYQRTTRGNLNFSVLPDGTLTFGENYNTHSPLERYYIMDSSYTVIASVNTGNGYYVDTHDMLLMENGHYLMMSYDPQIVNMSLIVPGGNPEATVIGLVIQEVDLNENVYFQWRSWDHFEITDCTPDVNLLGWNIDYVHGNAFEFDDDGNILLSSRNLDEITKIDYNSGEVIWRFGKNASQNQFTIFNDPIGFSHQHDIRKSLNGNYTIFDNGNLHQSTFSRAMEYYIDEDNLEAQLVWNYQHNPIIYAPATGSFRELDNGKRIIGWGTTYSSTAMTELNPDNSISMELLTPDSITGYRALKYPWETNMFTTVYELPFGNFAGHDDPREMLIYVRNNDDNVLNITSTYNRKDVYQVSTPMPVTIPPGQRAVLSVLFNPSVPGDYIDVLTLNSDNLGNTRRIARQVILTGVLDEDLPAVFFDPPMGATNVDPSSELLILFSEPVRHEGGAEILDGDIPGIIELRENDQQGPEVPFTGTISDDKMTISIYPVNVLKNLQEYYIELLPDTLEDYDGNVLEYAEGSFFETGMMTGVEEYDGVEIQVFPNPTTGTFIIRYRIPDSGHRSQVTSIDLFEISGIMIRELVHQEVSQGAHEMEVDVSDLPTGVYLLKLQIGSEVVVKKLTVQ